MEDQGGEIRRPPDLLVPDIWHHFLVHMAYTQVDAEFSARLEARGRASENSEQRKLSERLQSARGSVERFVTGWITHLEEFCTLVRQKRELELYRYALCSIEQPVMPFASVHGREFKLGFQLDVATFYRCDKVWSCLGFALPMVVHSIESRLNCASGATSSARISSASVSGSRPRPRNLKPSASL